MAHRITERGKKSLQGQGTVMIAKTSSPVRSTSKLVEILQQNRTGQAVGVFSICSANRHVLEAGMMQAKRDNSLLLIESTSNQVNQFGGYTGQTPADFAHFVRELAQEQDFPMQQVVLGGDHLGPHVWRKESARTAMENGCAMVREYVRAGYTKIHVDASMHCADDAGDPRKPLADEIVSARAAELCKAAEAAHAKLPEGSPPPLYVIGTEVPIPGGEQSEFQAPEVTRAEDLANTLKLARGEFQARGLHSAWERVIAVVVQPGVEFGDSSVHAYDSAKTAGLSSCLMDNWSGVFEAHSTDFQMPSALQRMVRDHFAILKVGPWLTFAFREAVFALAAIENEWLGSRPAAKLSKVCEALEEAMIANPVHWRSHYRGDEASLRLARRYSYSDRSRYYWPQAEVGSALNALIANLRANPAPASLLSQYLPSQASEVRDGRLTNEPLDLIRSKILEVLDRYAFACGMKAGK
jgi:D-tagatose-1,6-bisphosphate aldolase subunit GatZ/KbaZ